jgi:hypothetical protein
MDSKKDENILKQSFNQLSKGGKYHLKKFLEGLVFLQKSVLESTSPRESSNKEYNNENQV